MKPIIVFDLGKTLVDFDYSIAAGRIAPRCNPRADPENFFSTHAALLTSYELGLLNTTQFFEQVKALSGFCGTQAEFGEAFADIFTPIQPMIDLHAELRRKKLATYVFSNTNDLAVDYIRKNFPFFNEFDGYILSYEHGFMKPAAKFYEILEQESGRRPGEIFFMDDRAENIEAGAVRGWKTILHQEPAKTREALLRFGLFDQA